MLDFPHLRGSLPGMDPLGNTFLRHIPPEMHPRAVSERNPLELLTRIPRIVTFQKTKDCQDSSSQKRSSRNPDFYLADLKRDFRYFERSGGGIFGSQPRTSGSRVASYGCRLSWTPDRWKRRDFQTWK